MKIEIKSITQVCLKDGTCYTTESIYIDHIGLLVFTERLDGKKHSIHIKEVRRIQSYPHMV